MARPTLTSVTQSTYSQPFVGPASKNITLQAGLKSYGNLPSGAATSDTIQVFADYACWDNTHDGAVDSNATNFRDPA